MTSASPAQTAQNIDASRRWVTRDLIRVFRCEIGNEANGGVSPATISSTIDSVAQGLLSLMFEDVDGEVDVLTALLVLRDRFPGDTQIADLLTDLTN